MLLFYSRNIYSIRFHSIWLTGVELCSCTSERQHFACTTKAFIRATPLKYTTDTWTVSDLCLCLCERMAISTSASIALVLWPCWVQSVVETAVGWLKVGFWASSLRIQVLIAAANVIRFFSETLAIYKSFTYLLTYKVSNKLLCTRHDWL